MAGAFDRDGELALLLKTQAGLADRFDLAVRVDVALKCSDVLVIEIRRDVFFESFWSHNSLVTS